MTARRNARETTERVLHIVKEPNSSIFNWNPKQISQELRHQRETFEKIIRKTKKETVTTGQLRNIFDKIE